MIRDLLPSDMEAVLDIWLHASIKAHAFISPLFWESKVADMREIYLPASITYVYEEEGLVKGFVSLYEDTVAALFVAPAYQGNGIGKNLLNKAKSLRQRLTLTVYRDNKKSVAFYEGCGFVATAEKVDEHTDQREIVMQFNP